MCVLEWATVVLEQAQLHAALDGVVQLRHVPARERAPHLLHRVVGEGAWVGGSRPPMEWITLPYPIVPACVVMYDIIPGPESCCI